MEFYNIETKAFKEIISQGIITPVIKIELLDNYENAYNELIEEISSEQVGNLSESYNQGVRKTISFSFFDPEGKFIPNPNDKNFWINRKFKVYLGISKKEYSDQKNPLLYGSSPEDILAYFKTNNVYTIKDKEQELLVESEDGELIYEENDQRIKSSLNYYWFSKGVFVTTDISASRDSSGEIITISGVDKFGFFGSETGYNQMIGAFSLPKGYTIPEIIFNILNQDIGNGQILDPIEPIIDPYYQKTILPFDINKSPGEYLGDSLIDLANTFKADIYYDDDGRLVFWRSLIGDENLNLPTIWDFYDNDSEYIGSSLNYNLVNTVNRVCVVGDNPSASIAPVAISENRNPLSPLNIDKIGIKNKYIDSSNVQTITEAKDYADYILKSLSIQENNISFNCTFIPCLTVNKNFTLTDYFYKIIKETFIIKSIQYPLGIGTITLTGSNVKELPTY